MALKFKVIHTILFLFFIITALVAFVLMETQKRMITFTGMRHLLLSNDTGADNHDLKAADWLCLPPFTQSGLFQNRSQLQIPFANLVLAYFAQSLMFVPVLVRGRRQLPNLNVHLQ